MNFRQITQYALKSECGKYTVSKTQVGTHYKYCAWRLGGNEIDHCLGIFATGAEARQCCDEDAKK